MYIILCGSGLAVDLLQAVIYERVGIIVFIKALCSLKACVDHAERSVIILINVTVGVVAVLCTLFVMKSGKLRHVDKICFVLLRSVLGIECLIFLRVKNRRKGKFFGNIPDIIPVRPHVTSETR